MLTKEHYLVQEYCQGKSFDNEFNTGKGLYWWMQSRQMHPRQIGVYANAAVAILVTNTR